MKITKSAKSTVAKSTAKVPAKVAKPTAPVAPVAKIAAGKATTLCAVGLRGVVLSSGLLHGDTHVTPTRDHNGVKAEFQPRPVKLGESVPACWKGQGAESLFGKAIGAYVSPAGENFRLFTLASALTKGIVRKVTFLADGKPAECFVPSGWTEKQQFPQYVGTQTILGRFEPKLHKDGAERQGGAHVKLELPKAAKK